VLVVDDEVELLRVLEEALTGAGHVVTAASSGREGITRFREGDYDAVLTDLGMTEMSGWELARAVRREGKPGVILGLVTGWGATISEEMVTAHGVDFVLAKPFDVAALVRRINQALEEKPTADRGRNGAPPA